MRVGFLRLLLWFDPLPLLTMLLPDVVIGFDCIVLLWLTRTLEPPHSHIPGY